MARLENHELVRYMEECAWELLYWAEKDVFDSLENDEKQKAKDDKKRVRKLEKICDLLQGCYDPPLS